MYMDIKTDLQCKSLVIVLAMVLKKPCLMKKFLHFHVVYEEFFIACGFTNSKSQIPIFQNILDQSEKSSFFITRAMSSIQKIRDLQLRIRKTM